jgi:hypothetical protein
MLSLIRPGSKFLGLFALNFWSIHLFCSYEKVLDFCVIEFWRLVSWFLVDGKSCYKYVVPNSSKSTMDSSRMGIWSGVVHHYVAVFHLFIKKFSIEKSFLVCTLCGSFSLEHHMESTLFSLPLCFIEFDSDCLALGYRSSLYAEDFQRRKSLFASIFYLASCGNKFEWVCAFHE